MWSVVPGTMPRLIPTLNNIPGRDVDAAPLSDGENGCVTLAELGGQVGLVHLYHCLPTKQMWGPLPPWQVPRLFSKPPLQVRFPEAVSPW